jgi:arylsulfatase
MNTLHLLAGAAVATTAMLSTDTTWAQSPPVSARKPNIVFILMDNLSYGEVGVYGGGITRGAATPRIDRLAAEGTRLTNFNVEAQCTPSRSAFMTGRFSIRSGTHSVPIGSGLEGLTRWEVTIAETLSASGYATAAFGKWHLGSDQGRLPNDQGFDEWYWIPRTTDEAFWPSEPAAKASGMPFEHIMEGRKGESSRELVVYDLDQRRLIDAEITRRTVDFMKRSVASGKPFYAYVPFTQVHVPTLPNPKFAGRTGFGDFPDSLAEMDAHVGEILGAVDDLGIRDDTIVVFTSDNGPEATRPWQGSSGPWRGYYFTHMEGSLRVPFIIRWPGRIPAGRVSNEIVHQVDVCTTFAKIAGASVPQDRPIDGVDQTDFLFGRSERSSRDGFPVFVADRLEAVKWRNWKVAFDDEQRDWWSPPVKLGTPKAFDLVTDPKEEYPATGLRNTWNAGPAIRIVTEFEQSLKKYPPIAPGRPTPTLHRSDDCSRQAPRSLQKRSEGSHDRSSDRRSPGIVTRSGGLARSARSRRGGGLAARAGLRRRSPESLTPDWRLRRSAHRSREQGRPGRRGLDAVRSGRRGRRARPLHPLRRAPRLPRQSRPDAHGPDPGRAGQVPRRVALRRVGQRHLRAGPACEHDRILPGHQSAR